MEGLAWLTLYGTCVVQALMAGLLIHACWRMSQWLWHSDELLEHLIVTGLLTVSLSCFLTLGLGVLNVLFGWLIFLGVSLIWLGTLLLKAESRVPFTFTVPAEIRWALVGVCLVSLPFLARSIFLVPLSWDGLTYHMYFPALWIREQAIFLPDSIYPYNYYAFYPKHFEVLETFVMVIAKNDVFAKLINFPLMLLTALVVALLCRDLGGSPLAAWCVGIFSFTLPAMFCWVATTYAEPLLNFSLLTAIYFSYQSWKEDGNRAIVCGFLAGLSVGMAAGTKYVAMYLVVLIVFNQIALGLAKYRGRWLSVHHLASFCIGGIATGSWWLMWNLLATGNPVYPVAVGPLPHLVDPNQADMESMSILTHFGPLWQAGILQQIWIGQFPLDQPWAVGTDLVFPPQMGFGIKLFFLIPVIGFGVWCGLRSSVSKIISGRWANAVAVFFVMSSIGVLTFTYLKLPFWGDVGSLYSNPRFAVPFVLVGCALGFAYLSQHGWDTWIANRLGILFLFDALILDLRFPYLNRIASLAILLVVLLLVYKFGSVASTYIKQRRLIALWVPMTLVMTLAIPFRELHRFEQWANFAEVHQSSHDRFVPAAEYLQTNAPGVTVAYTGEFVSMLYLYSGPRFERPLVYVPTYSGTINSPKFQGQLRKVMDQSAWEANLRDSRAEYLLSFRFCDQKLKASYSWPTEHQWATDMGFPVVFQDEYCCVMKITVPEVRNPSSSNNLPVPDIKK